MELLAARPLALVACVVVLLWLGYRHLSGRRAPVLIGLVALVLVVNGALEWRWIAAQGELSGAVRSVTGRDDVHVRCQRLGAAMFYALRYQGYVEYAADGSLPQEAFVTWETCQDLRGWLGSDKSSPSREQVVAVHVLAHEAMHLTGETNEARTECRALQRDATVARLLGATQAQGDALASRYWSEVYPQVGPDYRSADCAPGGAWDEAPGTAAWPTG
ncbi:hypothetical protein [Nocardioides rubriscoriae]|uniref:hypothetical protein n=1 Tax=Nocardioides rubriscoriae TaxID=642762 RepID=UPI0011DFBA7B|nr:hypothetical protein [Nocardioides rubriscoriae]